MRTNEEKMLLADVAQWASGKWGKKCLRARAMKTPLHIIHAALSNWDDTRQNNDPSPNDRKHIREFIIQLEISILPTANHTNTETAAKILYQLARHTTWHEAIRNSDAILSITMRLMVIMNDTAASDLINALCLLAKNPENHEELRNSRAVFILTKALGNGYTGSVNNLPDTLLNLAQYTENHQEICDADGVNILESAAQLMIESENWHDCKKLIEALQALGTDTRPLESALQMAEGSAGATRNFSI